MNVALPHRETAGVIAAAPWALVLLGFTLWMTMLRQSRTQSAGEPLQPTVPQPTVLAPQETAALQETTASEETAPAEVVAEHEPTAAAEREPSPPSETPEEAAQTPEPAVEADGETSPDEGQPFPEQPTAESEAADEPGTLAHNYWDTGNAGEPDSQPAIAPPAMRGRRVPAVPDEEEPPLPFVTVPRLRRVRSTPTPPEDDEEDQ